MKSHSSSSYSADLHDFKMNLTKTLNSNYMLTFNEQKRQLSSRFKQKSKRPHQISSIPCIPVKVIPNYYLNKSNEETDLTDSDEDNVNDDEISSNESILIKSKLNSPFLFRKSLTTSNDSANPHEIHSYVSSSQENLSNMSSSLVSTSISVNRSDSGLSSMNSTDLFIADLKECLLLDHVTSARSMQNTRRYQPAKLINTDEYSFLIIQFLNKFGYRSPLK